MSVEKRYQQLNYLYQQALKRSNWDQVSVDKQTPAEKMVLKIANISRKCSRQGPSPELNQARQDVSIAGSHFLNNHFGVSAHWDNLPERIAASVVMELLRRDSS